MSKDSIQVFDAVDKHELYRSNDEGMTKADIYAALQCKCSYAGNLKAQDSGETILESPGCVSAGVYYYYAPSPPPPPYSGKQSSFPTSIRALHACGCAAFQSAIS